MTTIKGWRLLRQLRCGTTWSLVWLRQACGYFGMTIPWSVT